MYDDLVYANGGKYRKLGEAYNRANYVVNDRNTSLATANSGYNKRLLGKAVEAQGPNWGGMSNTLSLGSGVFYALEKSVYNGKYWLDANGNYRSMELLKKGANGKYIRGVQGLRVSQASAFKVSSRYANAGKVVGGVGIGITLIQYNTGQISRTEASIDLIMGGIGFTGWGAPISLIYFGGKYIYETTTGNTLFEKPKGSN